MNALLLAVTLVAVGHEGTVLEGPTPESHVTRWDVRLVASEGTIDPAEVPLVHPLPADTRVEEGAEAVRDVAGQVVALRLTPGRWSGSWHGRRPYARSADLRLAVAEGDPTKPPLVETEAVQRVVVRHADNSRLHPSSSPHQIAHIGWWGTPGLRRKDQWRTDRHLEGFGSGPGPAPLYVLASELETGVVAGDLAPDEERRRGALAASVGAFAAITVLLVFGLRQASVDASASGTSSKTGVSLDDTSSTSGGTGTS